MYWQVISMTITAGLLDSLNPIAISQQVVLQSTSKSRHGILGYILGIGVTNFLFGLLFYFGLGDFFGEIIFSLQQESVILKKSLLIILGLGLVIFSLGKILFLKNNHEKKPAVKKDSLLSMKQLFVIGVLSCLMELTSALPYLTYLTALSSFNLSKMEGILVLLFYNLGLFNLPLLVLYAASLIFTESFVKIYTAIQRLIYFFLKYVLPLFLFLLGSFFLYLGFFA